MNTAAPTVSAVSPSSGDISGGTAITIDGTDFRPGVTVTVGGVACTNLTLVSSTQITCTVGIGSAGAVDVVVTNVDSRVTTAAGAYIYVAPTTTTTVHPTTTVSPSTTVAISNTNTPGSSPTTTVATSSPNGGSVTTTTVQSDMDQSKTTGTTSGTSNSASNPDLDIVVQADAIATLEKKDFWLTVDGIDVSSSLTHGQSVKFEAGGFDSTEKVLVVIGRKVFTVVDSQISSTSGDISGTFVVPQELLGEQVLALYAPDSRNGFQMTITVVSPESKAGVNFENDSSDGVSLSFIALIAETLGVAVFFFLLVAKRRRDEKNDNALL